MRYAGKIEPSLTVPAEFFPAVEALARIGSPPEKIAWDLLASIDDSPESVDPVKEIKAAAKLDGDLTERVLIWHAAQRALPRVDTLPLDNSGRARLASELRQYHAVRGSIAAGAYPFVRAAKMATLRLYPAGPMDWVISGIPRSWVFEAAGGAGPARPHVGQGSGPGVPSGSVLPPGAELPHIRHQRGFLSCARLLWFIARRLRGFSPCFFIHVAPAPKNRALVLEKEVLKSYHRMARCLELQPQMRAIIGYAWFFDPAAVRDQPHLEALNRPFVAEGGTIVPLGLAPAESGVLEGNAARKKDYLEGKLQYRYGLAIWPRDAALRWMKAHPELAE